MHSQNLSKLNDIELFLAMIAHARSKIVTLIPMARDAVPPAHQTSLYTDVLRLLDALTYKTYNGTAHANDFYPLQAFNSVPVSVGSVEQLRESLETLLI